MLMLGARGAGLAGGGVLLLWSVPPARTQLWSCVVSVLFLRLYLYTCIGQGPLGSPRGAERGLRLGTGLGGSGGARPHGRGIALSYREAGGGPACSPLPSHPTGLAAGVTSPSDRTGTEGGRGTEELRHGPKKGRGEGRALDPGRGGQGHAGGVGGGGLRDGAERGWCSFTVGSMKRLG